MKLVWWGIRNWDYWMNRPNGILGNAYKWMFRIGPIEVRRLK